MIRIPKAYKPLFSDEYKFFVYYGGRGGGKTENIAQVLILKAIQKPNTRILIGREYKNDNKDSTKATLKQWIEKLGLEKSFKIMSGDGDIECKNGSVFLFKAFAAMSITQIKSISNIDLSWFEEADTLSERSWEIAIPSIMRTKRAQVIFSFNPKTSDDIIYKKFILETPPPKSYIKKVNFSDNPFFKYSSLEIVRADDELKTPKAKYAHKWLGEILPEIDGALFTGETIKKMQTRYEYARGDFSRIVIGCDPATTHKNFSNKYGVVVCGLTKDGQGYILADKSAIMTPHEFASLVNALWSDYSADCVIVETNQGGDFLRYAILSENPAISVKEVRAIKDKVNRALPLANLCEMGKINFPIDINGEFLALKRQMRLMSSRGFGGETGESPDNLDAVVWAFSNLFNYGETAETMLKTAWFDFDKDFIVPESQIKAFVCTDEKSCVALIFGIYGNSKSQKKILINDYFVSDLGGIDTILNDISDYAKIAPDTSFFSDLDADFYELKLNNLYEQTLNNLANFRQNLIMFSENMSNKTYGNLSGNLPKIAVSRFNADLKSDIFIKSLNELLAYLS